MYILGSDRSRRNSPAPLQVLYNRGHRFFFFKVTDGLTRIDPVFNASWQEAKKIPGAARAAYHWFDGRFDGKAQAAHYCSQLSNGASFKVAGCLPPTVDIEDLVIFDAAGNVDHAATLTANKWVVDNWKLVLQRFNDFLAEVKRITGLDCIIYSYNGYLRDTFRKTAKFPNNRMWISSLQATCPNRYDSGKKPDFWQWTYNLSGSDMDGDYFTGTQDQLNTLANIK